MRFLYFIIGIAFGFVLIKFHKWIVDNTGIRWPAAENILGPGSMHTIWQFAGVVIILLSFYILFGGFNL